MSRLLTSELCTPGGPLRTRAGSSVTPRLPRPPHFPALDLLL